MCGLKTGTLSDEELKNVASTHEIEGKLRVIDVVVIDEISMISDDILRQVDVVMKQARRSSRPFGGTQIILAGDFLQLPPVKGNFCFQWSEFDKFIPHRVYLHKNFRCVLSATVILFNVSTHV